MAPRVLKDRSTFGAKAADYFLAVKSPDHHPDLIETQTHYPAIQTKCDKTITDNIKISKTPQAPTDT